MNTKQMTRLFALLIALTALASLAGRGEFQFPHQVVGDFGTVCGGVDNEAGDYATVCGGSRNSASAFHAVVGGGSYNTASVGHATIGGGTYNTASATRATVGGGYGNTASNLDATIGGGGGNTASGKHATVGGGSRNIASGFDATIAGGSYNMVSGTHATVGGGSENTAPGFDATVAGGAGNTASGTHAAVGGGVSNQATDIYATVGGGYANTAGGSFSSVPGGSLNQATGDHSFASGHRAMVGLAHSGAFLYADANDFDFHSAAANEFAVRATGGVRLVTAIDRGGNPMAGVELASGSGSWASLSDQEMKENVAPVDEAQILALLAQLQVSTWNYTSQDPSIRHIGPTAQDFHAAFGVGEDDKHISAVDADGVALAAIQGLCQLVQEKEAQITAQRRQIVALEARVAALEQANKMDGSPARPPSSGTSADWLFLGGLCLGGMILMRHYSPSMPTTDQM
jgi:hypothetical protein